MQQTNLLLHFSYSNLPLTEVEFDSCIHCNYFNDRARKVRKIIPEGCKIKSGIVFRIVLTLSLKSLHSTQDSLYFRQWKGPIRKMKQ